MKVSQIAVGKRYESKDGKEVRRVVAYSDTDFVYVTDFPTRPPCYPERRHQLPKQDFAGWAKRPFGTSTFGSVDGKKFLAKIRGADVRR